MACIHCRRRKIRCDGTEPACGVCQRLGKQCDYEAITEEENIVAREKKRASRFRKAQLAGVAGLSTASSPTSMAFPRFVVPMPGTPYGALRSPDIDRRPKPSHSVDSFHDIPEAMAHRRRGATVSVPMAPWDPVDRRHVGADLGFQDASLVQEPENMHLAGLGEDLPPWARSTFASQGLGWPSGLPDVWQGPSREQAEGSHNLKVPQGLGRMDPPHLPQNLRRRSSVDDVNTFRGPDQVYHNGSDQVKGHMGNAVSSNWPSVPDADSALTSQPAWLRDRSVSHQRLSRDQMLQWTKYFGDRTRPPLQQDAGQRKEVTAQEAPSAAEQPPQEGLLTLRTSSQTPHNLNQPSNNAVNAPYLHMDMGKLRQSAFAAPQASPPILSPSTSLGRRNSSDYASDGASGLAAHRRFSGQDPLEVTGSHGSQSVHSSPAVAVDGMGSLHLGPTFPPQIQQGVGGFSQFQTATPSSAEASPLALTANWPASGSFPQSEWLMTANENASHLGGPPSVPQAYPAAQIQPQASPYAEEQQTMSVMQQPLDAYGLSFPQAAITAGSSGVYQSNPAINAQQLSPGATWWPSQDPQVSSSDPFQSSQQYGPGPQQ
ncbi:unnamed protein product [Parajaminaea phylloscopi]